MPSETRCVEIRLPEAELLADLYEIRFDLEAAARLCERAIEIHNAPGARDFVTEEGLVTAAIVKYGRCFTSGRRLRLTVADLHTLDSGTIGAHEYFHALRDRFVAHAVNAFEETYVTASATKRDGVLQPVTSLNAGQHKIVLAAETACDLRRVARSVVGVVNERIRTEKATLLAFIQSLPLETVHAFDLHLGRLAGRHQVKRPRARRRTRRP